MTAAALWTLLAVGLVWLVLSVWEAVDNRRRRDDLRTGGRYANNGE